MISSQKVIMLAAALAAFAAGLFCNDGNVVRNGAFSETQARVGHPLTPMSYAGVARRTTRRAVAVGAAAGAAGAFFCFSFASAAVGFFLVTTRFIRPCPLPGGGGPVAAI